MRLLRLFAIYTLLFSIHLYAVTISGTVNCDINDNGTIESGEVCPDEGVWVKLYNEARGKWISQEPLHPSGTFAFVISATGDFRVFVDNNGDTVKDSTPTPPINMLFSVPLSGSYDITIPTLDDNSTGNDFVLIPDPACDCSGGDYNLTRAPITIDGNMDDWATVLLDPDNGICDSGTHTDYDINKSNTGEIQSTGRNLIRFSWTGEDNPNGYVYGYTERLGSTTNTETFLFYKDDDADGLMESGDIALTAGWQGNTGTVKMEICDYVPADPAGDPMVWQQSDVGTPLLYPGGTTVPQEWVGKADGYTLNGGLTNCRTSPELVGSGSADGLRMEWVVAWNTVGMQPFQPITYHVSTMNASVNQNNPPGQVDDNMGSCPLPAPVVKLDVNKTVDNETPRIGEDVTYTITVTNSGDPTSSLVVNDTLPDNMTYVSFSGTDWTCSNTGQDVNCSYNGILMNGGSTSVDIVSSVDNNTSLWGDTLTNNACASSDENATLVCDDAPVTVYTPMVMLDVNKTASNLTPYVGTQIFYRIAITNNGPDIANNIVVNDALPSGGVSYVDYYLKDNWTCTETTANTLDCTYDIGLGVGQTAELFIIVDVVGTAGTDYTNTASAHADENTTDVSDSVTITPVTPPVPATLNVEKGVSNSTPLTGENIVYGIILSNVGALDATNVVFTDILPAGVTYVGADYNVSLGGTFTFTPDDNVTWSGFTLPGGASTIIQITVTVDAAIDDTVTNTACAHSDENTTDVCFDVDFTVRAPDVELLMDKSVDNENPWVEEVVTYTLVVTNNGTDTANNVEVNDPLPGEVTYISDSPSAGSYNDATGLWDGFNLPPNTSEELNITVSIDLGTEGTLVSNLAIATADEDGIGDQDDANLTVYTPNVILTILKVSDQNFPSEDTNITYTIIVNNIGDDNATGVEVSDDLPADVTFISAGGNGWNCVDNGTIDCTYPFDIAPGYPTSFDINVTVNPDTAGTTLTNTACTFADENATLVCVDANITVNQNLDLVVTKDVDNPTPNQGDTIVYTITVTNNGPINATGVEITENIGELAGLTDINATPPLADQDTWVVGDLAVGQTATLLVTATVTDDASGEYINFASLSGLDQDDIDPTSNQAQATITVTCPCENVSSDSSPAMNKTVGALMIMMTLMIGLYFVRREEEFRRDER